MTLKRVGSLKNKKHKHCLQCGRVLVGLKDNTEHECSFCGQKHFVDIYGTMNSTVRLVLEIAIHCLVIYQTYVLWIKRQNAIDIS